MYISVNGTIFYATNKILNDNLKKTRNKVVQNQKPLTKIIKLPKSRHKARCETAIRNKNYATNFQSGLVIVSV